MHDLQLLSFLQIVMMGDPHSEVVGFMNSYSNNYFNCFFTSFDSKMDCLSNPMLGNRDSSNSWNSCSISLLGGNLLISWNTSLLDSLNWSSYYFFLLTCPSKDALISILHFPCYLFSHKNNDTSFLCVLVNLLSECELINERFDLLLYA